MAESPNTHFGLSNREWIAAGLGGASLLPMLFGGGDDGVERSITQLEKATKTSQDKSAKFEEEGADILGPVSKYLKDVTGGSRQALLGATAPERQRIIDQYDTAKRSIAEFAPRGGGQASAMAHVLTREASDLATTTANARTQGFAAAATLGTTLRQLGVTEDQIASGNLSTLIQAALAKSAQDQQGGFNLGSALGTLAGIFL